MIISWLVLRSSFRPGRGTHQRPFCLANLLANGSLGAIPNEFANRPWKCKEEKDRRSPLVHSRKLAEHDNFTSAVSRRYRDRGQRQENPDRAKNQPDFRIRCRAPLEKIIPHFIPFPALCVFRP